MKINLLSRQWWQNFFRRKKSSQGRVSGRGTTCLRQIKDRYDEDNMSYS